MPDDELSSSDFWRRVLTERAPEFHAERWVMAHLPTDPRCTWCKAPFGGVGGRLLRQVFHRDRSNLNPLVCNICDRYFQRYPGGAEVELSLLFADVRGSTALAEQMSATAYSDLIERFYTEATRAIVAHDGLIEKFVGDEAVVLFTPGFSGQEHALKALRAARAILESTGHGRPEGPWIPIGAGVHTGVAFVGSVGSGGVRHLAVLGDLPNTTARLAGLAGAGEILVSDASCAAADVGPGREHRDLEIRGRTERLGVCVFDVDSRLGEKQPV